MVICFLIKQVSSSLPNLKNKIFSKTLNEHVTKLIGRKSFTFNNTIFFENEHAYVALADNTMPRRSKPSQKISLYHLWSIPNNIKISQSETSQLRGLTTLTLKDSQPSSKSLPRRINCNNKSNTNNAPPPIAPACLFLQSIFKYSTYLLNNILIFLGHAT